MTRITLGNIGNYFSLVLAIFSLAVLVYFAQQFWSTQNPDFANAFTGAGAVLAASISALVSFRTISIAEEAQKPYPYPYIDTQSRHGLALIKIKNAGGSAAHHVYIEWEGSVPKLRQSSGPEEAEPIHFAGDDAHAIAVLMPGEEQATMLGASHLVAKKIKMLEKELRGQVVFRDIKGNLHRQPFYIETSFFQWSLVDETELLRAQYAVSMIPDALAKINTSLTKISEHTKP